MASTIKERFIIPKKYNTWSFVLMAVGLVAIIILFLTTRATTPSAADLKSSGFTDAESFNAHRDARFWASLLQNSVYFLLVTNAVMFFITATTLAWGGWQLSFRRVSEAISVAVPVIGIIS